ncbi:unnamed protein product [Brassica oleracea]|uniref:(rape) hypothetical protein n=1 Tax=Brassica napus TaxID=3708 RepID=A0A816JDN0_BRANA|nr:unnamed protein product [Brassica napus]
MESKSHLSASRNRTSNMQTDAGLQHPSIACRPRRRTATQLSNANQPLKPKANPRLG